MSTDVARPKGALTSLDGAQRKSGQVKRRLCKFSYISLIKTNTEKANPKSEIMYDDFTDAEK